MFPLSLLGQTVEFERKDSIQIDGFTCPTYVLKINNYSASDPAKVFIIPSKSFDSLTSQIPKLYFSKKQEYNEYYVLGVEDMLQVQIVKYALTKFLNQIDRERAERKRSTFLKMYSWDNIHNKVVYLPTTKDISQADNVYYLHSTKDLCRYMACTNK